MNYFKYNNINSTEFNIYFETLPPLPITFNSTGHILIAAGLKKNTDDINAVRKWLSNTSGILEFSFDEKIWQVNDVIVTEIERNDIFIRINIEFFVDAYSLTANNAALTFTENFNNIIVINPYAVATLPLIEIIGNGDIDISFNDAIINLKNVNSKIIIDSYIQESYDDAGLKNRDMTGQFPILTPGSNVIAASGDITEIIILPRWRW